MLLLCYIKNVTLQISGGCSCLSCTNQANLRGCTCLKCTNQANNAYLIITPFNQIGTEKIKESRP